jgi:hypothetical protein
MGQTRMTEATIRVPVPREFLLMTEQGEGDEKPLELLMPIMRKVPLVLGEHDLGEWWLLGIEVTMERSPLAGEFPGTSPLALMPTYWATLSRVLP